MHVLIVPSWYPANRFDVNGVFFRDQALALAAHGHRVAVLSVSMRSLKSAFPSGAGRPEITRREDDEGIITYRSRIWSALPRVPYGNYMLWRKSCEKLLLEYVDKEGWPDIIHAHSALIAGAVAAEWKQKYGVPYVLTEHSTAFARGILRPWQLRLAGHAAVKASARIAVSPEFGKLLSRELSNDDYEWDWIPNVVADRFYYKPSVVGEPTRHVRFLNLALMTEKKGQADLLLAFSRAFGVNAQAELWFGGDGPLKETLRAEAERLGIQGQVRFLGKIAPADVPELLQQVDVMVVSSHYETFGVVAAEALMTGTPVVATRCGGPECIVEEGDGLLVAPRAVDELTAALSHMAIHFAGYDRQAISQRAHERFSGEAVAAQLTQVYARILGQSEILETVR